MAGPGWPCGHAGIDLAADQTELYHMVKVPMQAQQAHFKMCLSAERLKQMHLLRGSAALLLLHLAAEDDPQQLLEVIDGMLAGSWPHQGQDS